MPTSALECVSTCQLVRFALTTATQLFSKVSMVLPASSISTSATNFERSDLTLVEFESCTPCALINHNMRKLIVSTLSAVALCAASTAANAQLKLGTVDMNKVFSAYFKTKDAEDKINDARAAAKKELDDRLETLKKAMDEINKT